MSQPRTRFIVAGGFAVLVGLMAVLTVLGGGVLTALYADIEGEKVSSEKIRMVYLMREAIRRRSFSMMNVQAMQDFFDRDVERQKFNGYARNFLIARDRYFELGVTAEERDILTRLQDHIRPSQELVNGAMEIAVEAEDKVAATAMTHEAIQSQQPLFKALDNLVAFQERTSRARSADISHRQNQIWDGLFAAAVIILVLGILVSVYSYRREVNQTNQLLSEIGERKQAEEFAQGARARLEEILRIAPDAVISTDADGAIQLFNRSAETLFGYDAEEVLGKPMEILMPEYFRNHHRLLVEDFSRSKDNYRTMDRRQDIYALRRDGSEFPAAASVTKTDIQGERIFTVMLRDITEGKEAEKNMVSAKEEAEAANRSKSDFLAAMSHDLRTPLNAILGFAEIISLQQFGQHSDKYPEYAHDIKTSGELLLALVNDILDLSAIEAGKKSLSKETVSLPEVVRECFPIIEERAKSYGVTLVMDIPEDLPQLFADKMATKQILLNLLTNAVKFTPEGGVVTLRASAMNAHHIIEVSDTGTGIPVDKLETITAPFVRGQMDPHKTQEGTGLGLTIVKSLVDLHDGELEITSSLDEGTTVNVMFPITA